MSALIRDGNLVEHHLPRQAGREASPRADSFLPAKGAGSSVENTSTPDGSKDKYCCLFLRAQDLQRSRRQCEEGVQSMENGASYSIHKCVEGVKRVHSKTLTVVLVQS